VLRPRWVAEQRKDILALTGKGPQPQKKLERLPGEGVSCSIGDPFAHSRRRSLRCLNTWKAFTIRAGAILPSASARGPVCGWFFPGLRKNLKSRTFRSFRPLFERADCTAVKTAKAKEEDRTKIDPLEKSYVSTETGW
jgi:hypothetical protein